MAVVIEKQDINGEYGFYDAKYECFPNGNVVLTISSFDENYNGFIGDWTLYDVNDSFFSDFFGDILNDSYQGFDKDDLPYLLPEIDLLNDILLAGIEKYYMALTFERHLFEKQLSKKQFSKIYGVTEQCLGKWKRENRFPRTLELVLKGLKNKTELTNEFINLLWNQPSTIEVDRWCTKTCNLYKTHYEDFEKLINGDVYCCEKSLQDKFGFSGEDYLRADIEGSYDEVFAVVESNINRDISDNEKEKIYPFSDFYEMFLKQLQSNESGYLDFFNNNDICHIDSVKLVQECAKEILTNLK